MDSQQTLGSGFPSHLQEQLNQASQQIEQGNQQPQRIRGRSSNRGRGNRGQSSQTQQGNGQLPSAQLLPPQPVHGGQTGSHSYGHSQNVPSANHNRNVQNFGSTPHPNWSGTPPSSDMQSFPPLGSAAPPRQQRQVPQWNQQQPQQRIAPPLATQARAQTLLERTRGNVYRGGPPINQTRNRPQQYFQPNMMNPTEFQRPQNQHTQLFNPTSTYETPQKAFRHMVMLQSDYLNHVASTALQFQISNAELQEKEEFRKELESIARNMIADCIEEPSTLDPRTVVLKCYGSLANGFGLRGSDMDLLLMFPTNIGVIGDIEVESRRKLEKALLDIGYGGRLLTNTRVPILRVCQKPSAELLDNLRKTREKWEEERLTPSNPSTDIDDKLSSRLPEVSTEQAEAATRFFAELEDAPSDIPLPPSPQREHANLEYKGDVGIQCDINFSNFVAIHNTKLLRNYCQHDKRVRDIGIFVKTWAKARGINTPYHGTLSSYGYILMVLHYLMNIANPPVIPNLQHMARDEDAWNHKTDIELFDGFDVRFVSDERKIAQAMDGMRSNHESVGSLLRGFFWYYGHSQGFHWTQSVISIRTKGGIMKKYQKGWTEAKWADGSGQIRLRYLLCIEDPFEVDHNIARTVGHSGLVAIRDEFRRAWRIIERVERVPAGWQWKKEDGELGEEFMEAVLNRGDLLRQDQDFHRQKLKQMKQDMETKTKALKLEGSMEEQKGENHEAAANGAGMSHHPDSASPYRTAESSKGSDRSSPKLTRDVGDHQDSRRKSKGRIRKLKSESEDESEDESEEVVIDNGKDDDSSRNRTSAVNLNNEEFKNEEDCYSEPAVDDISSRNALTFSEQLLSTHGLDDQGRPIPWDINTQDGRWLRWRDSKIEQRTWYGATNRHTVDLDRQCPYDPLRPLADPASFLPKENISPPWPMTKDGTEVARPKNGERKASSVQKELHPRPTPQPEKIGTGWDRKTAGGRWLEWRDKQIRTGFWKGDKFGRYERLSQEFSYNPNMSSSELGAHNAKLRERYHKVLFRAKASQDPSAAATSQFTTDGNFMGQLDATVNDFQSVAATTRDSSPEKSPEIEAFLSSSGRTTKEPDLDFLRNQRLAFFAKQSEERPSELHPMVQEEVLPNVATYMKDAGISIEVQDAAQNSSNVVELGSKETYSSPKLQKPSGWSAVYKPEPIGTNARVPDVEGPGVEPELAYTTSNLSSLEEPLVPETLCLNMYDLSRPRDQDPNVIPIPRKLGFQFDARQLRDIEIIANGGNGCARDGREYDIEDDYEWGGGGLMGWKKSSSGQVPYESGGAGEEWVPGTGDEEGLLEELPGFI